MDVLSPLEECLSGIFQVRYMGSKSATFISHYCNESINIACPVKFELKTLLGVIEYSFSIVCFQEVPIASSQGRLPPHVLSEISEQSSLDFVLHNAPDREALKWI